MAYDFALDSATGDFLFGPTHDVLGVTGPELDAQRISIRCKIPRGTFMYDEDGTLGSFLHLVSRGSPSGIEDAKMYVQEALDEAEGISVESIDVSFTEFGRLDIDVKFSQTGSLDETIDDDFEADLPEFDANIQFGHSE